MQTETLIGGLCDGLECPKSDSPHMYAGRRGDGVVNVYLRRADGRLHYSHRLPARVITVTTTSSCNTVSFLNG